MSRGKGYNWKLPNIEKMKELYFGQELSLTDIAKQYDVTKGAVRLKFSRHGISLRTHQEIEASRANYIDFDTKCRQFLDGLLLGDGTLALAGYGKSACYRHTDKHKGYIVWLKGKLDAFGIETAEPYTPPKQDVWSTRSKYYRGDLRNLRGLWYPKGVKRIPNDVFLAPSTLFNWYIGDGCYSGGKAMLCIEFDKLGRAQMAEQLNGLGINNSIYSYGIYIRSASRGGFFEYMARSGLDIPRCYQYKFPSG